MRFLYTVRSVNTVRAVPADCAGALELPAVLGIPGVCPVRHCPLEPRGEGGFGEELAGGADGRAQRLGERRNLFHGGEGGGCLYFVQLFCARCKNLRQQVGALGAQHLQ